MPTPSPQSNAIKKVVLAYSGGLDTSVILQWLRTEYEADVIAFCADLGQGEDLQAIKNKAQAVGAAKVYVEDLRETFVKDYVFPMLRANAVYEGSLSVGHLDCPPADRPAPDRDRATGKSPGRESRRHGKRKRSGPVRTHVYGHQSRYRHHRGRGGNGRCSPVAS